MKSVKCKINSEGSGNEFNFELYDNTELIAIDDYFLFSFGGQWEIGRCSSEHEMKEINQHDRPRNPDIIDLVHGFWKNCYKIKTTDFDLSKVF